MIIPPSFPGGAHTTLPAEVLPSEVGALAGVRAVAGNGERQDQERAGSSAGVIFEATAQVPPLQLYGPDGKPVEGPVAAEDAEKSERVAPDQVGPLQGSEETGAVQEDQASEETGQPKTEQELSPEEQREIQDLRARDVEVRAHEAEHVAAGGHHVRGGASFEFTVGPDGQQYAVGGEVGIDTSPVAGDPQATAEKARVVRAAALAPASPSGADRAIAAQAAQMEAQAMSELAAEQREQAAEGSEQPDEAAGTPYDAYVQGEEPEASTFSLVA